MRTIRIKAYKFEELTEAAKQNAINTARNKSRDYSFYFDEIARSGQAAADLFGFTFGHRYTDVVTHHIEDDILELSGVRLYKYIINNYYSSLFKPKHIKSIDKLVYWRPFICKHNVKGVSKPWTSIYSKLKVDNCCTLTGICYDNDILQPIYDFLVNPDRSTTFEDLLKSIEHAISKCFSDTEDWINSDEFLAEELKNQEYEFTKEGEIIDL